MGAPTASGIHALLDPTAIQHSDTSPGNSHQFKADFAYGFPVHNNRLTMTPGVAVALSPTTSTTSLRWSLAPHSQHSQTPPWQLSLQGEREENTTTDTPVDHSLKLNFSLPF
ncbi:hypothetical protein [Candidatus Synechococcus spongiarum]|uniref:hypothetical protein n=1 Tax=Candidatus Synechococcus spongiarum TaxID=431041 RepID=UPI0004715DCA|nr:hypothetical protein [Candidatus Synechococcus spongiarum]